MIRVLLADDHPPLRVGLRLLLEQAPDIKVVGEAETGLEALELIEELEPDVVVLDCEMPEMDGIAVAREVQQRGLPVRVLALSAYDDPRYVRGMVQAGAVGYLLKNEAAEVIVAAVRAAERESYFSPSVTNELLALVRGEGLEAERAEETLTGRDGTRVIRTIFLVPSILAEQPSNLKTDGGLYETTYPSTRVGKYSSPNRWNSANYYNLARGGTNGERVAYNSGNDSSFILARRYLWSGRARLNQYLRKRRTGALFARLLITGKRRSRNVRLEPECRFCVVR